MFAALSACASQGPVPPPRQAVVLPPPEPTATSEAVLEPASTPGELDQARARVPVEPNDPQWGSSLAPVTIVEFADFQCPFCARVQPTLSAIRNSYGPERVRIVWKHNPLPFHIKARPAALASAAVFSVGSHDAFWRFHDQAFANQQDLNDASFERWAVASGIPAAAFRAAYQSERIAADVEVDLATARSIAALAAPHFRINGLAIVGAQPFENFKQVIDAQLVEAKRLTDGGTPREHVYAILTNKNYQEPPPAVAAPPSVEEVDRDVYRLPVLPTDPQRGPRDALVTIIEFSDFQCPFCKRVEATLGRVLSEHPGDVRLVWKDNPLAFHPRARPAAHFARFAAATQGEPGFWAAHDALFESAPKLEDADLQTIAQKLLLDWNRASLAMRKERFNKGIQADIDLADDFKAQGTPMFFVNGRRLNGAQPYEKFEELVQETKAAAEALVASGVARANVYEALTKNGKGPILPERKQVPPPDAQTPSRGNARAKVVIQMWADFQCPFCSRVNPTLLELEQKRGRDIRIVWRHLPLPFHADAGLAAEAAQEVFAQRGHKAFWAYQEKLFALQRTPAGLKRENLERLAAELGVSMPAFRSALDSHKHRAKVEADAKIAADAGINGTPAFVINGYFLSGTQLTHTFEKMIDRALADLRAGKPKTP